MVHTHRDMDVFGCYGPSCFDLSFVRLKRNLGPELSFLFLISALFCMFFIGLLGFLVSPPCQPFSMLGILAQPAKFNTLV